MSVVFTCVFLLISVSLSAQNLQVFTGNWRVDPGQVQEKAVVKTGKVTGPQIPPPPPPEHQYTIEHIRQLGNALKISGGEAGTTAVYTIDPSGKEVSDSIPDAPGSVRIARTRWGKGVLVTRWRMKRNGEVFMSGTDVHAVDAEGRLVLTRNIESSRHRARVRLVLERLP